MKFKLGDRVGKTKIISIETNTIENSKGKHTTKQVRLEGYKRPLLVRNDEQGEYIWLSFVGKSEGIKTRPEEER